MVDLSTNDTAILTRVASFPSFAPDRRMRMLVHSSNRAKAIGRIIVKGEKRTDRPEYKRVAKKFAGWTREAGR